MKHTVTKLGEGNESANSVLGNCVTDLELKYHASEKASNTMDTQHDLLQFPQDDDCKSVDIIPVSKIVQLDHG